MVKLPDWLKKNEKGAYLVDSDKVYPIVLKALNIGSDLDQYQLEVAYQCVKMKVQDLAEANGDGPANGKSLPILMQTSDKAKWSIKSYPAGRGAKAATQGREAKVHYARIKNLI